jgi:hypothetical protein
MLRVVLMQNNRGIGISKNPTKNSKEKEAEYQIADKDTAEILELSRRTRKLKKRKGKLCSSCGRRLAIVSVNWMNGISERYCLSCYIREVKQSALKPKRVIYL